MSAQCILDFLYSNGVRHFTVRDCQLLVQYFDIDQDNMLSFTEFMQMILPCDNLQLRSEASQREPISLQPNGRLNEQVEKYLTDFFEQEVQFHSSLFNLKQELHTRFDWNMRDAFNYIDVTQDGFINHRNIQIFLKDQGFYANDEHLIAIIRRLDSDAD